MIRFESQTVAYFFYIAAAVLGVLLLYLGFRFGRWIGIVNSHKLLEQKEKDLFTAQKGFKALYEDEIGKLKQQNAELRERVSSMEGRVEEYRKKAAGFGGLFSSGNRRSEAMYALLLENEALEEALLQKNEKLRREREEAVAEQLRSTGYRRILISQLLSDERIKGYVTEQLSDEKRLPEPRKDANGEETPSARSASDLKSDI